MSFDVDAARKDGLPDTEILGYLAKKHNFDIDSALKDGNNPAELLTYLANKPEPSKGKSFLQKTGEFAVKEVPPVLGMMGGAALGGAAGLLGAPATGGASVPAGEMAGEAGGYALGNMASKSLQEHLGMAPPTTFASKVSALPGDTGKGALYSLGGKYIIGPALSKVKAGFPAAARFVTGVAPEEWAKKGQDLMAGLPDFGAMGKKIGEKVPAIKDAAKGVFDTLQSKIGGAMSVPDANAAFKQTLKDLKIPEESLTFGRRATDKIKNDFIDTIEARLNHPNPAVADVETPKLLKARKAIGEQIGKAYENGNVDAAREYVALKKRISGILESRAGGDKLAEAFANTSRAKMASNTQSVLPNSDYLSRRAITSAVAFGNPKFLGIMSPLVLSGAQMAAHATPNQAVTLGAAALLRRMREEKK